MEATDTRSFKEFYARGVLFEHPSRYDIIRVIGHGAYGIVCSANDTQTGEKVAIKCVNIVSEGDMSLKRLLREICLLRHFRHANVIALRDMYISTKVSAHDFQDVYMVMELMDTDLHQVITSGQVLTDDHLQYFTYQMLVALRHIHTANVIHRDLKPSNILVNADCDLKICDFGLAREDSNDPNKTPYVVTRWYRAPEVILMLQNYTAAVDMWSVGCILAEMITKKPLFPGKDYVKQLTAVIDVIGSPTAAEIEHIHKDSKAYVQRNLIGRKRRNMDEIFPNTPVLLRDLLDKILIFDPQKRITVNEALNHPYLDSLKNSGDGVEDENVNRFTFKYDNDMEVSLDILRKAIWDEVQLYHNQQMAE